MGDEGRMGEKKTVGGRKRAGERDFSFLINLSDPVPLMPVPAYPTAPASAGSGRQQTLLRFNPDSFISHLRLI